MIQKTSDGYAVTGKDARSLFELCELIRKSPDYANRDYEAFEPFADDLLSAEKQGE